MVDFNAQAKPAHSILLRRFCRTGGQKEFDLRCTLNALDVEQAIHWRHEIQKVNARGGHGYACPECHERLTLVFKQPDAFHFRHIENSKMCPLQDDRRRQQYEQDLTYTKAAESQEHRQMREELVGILNADPNFEDISQSRLFPGMRSGWRQPDVHALYKGQRIAFELQLSNTYLDTIIQRREEYLAHGVPMIWLMSDFDPKDTNIAKIDTVILLDGTALCMDIESIEASRAQGELRLNAVQYVRHAQIWDRRLISMADLIVDVRRATVSLPKSSSPVQEPKSKPEPLRGIVLANSTRHLLEALVHASKSDSAQRKTQLWHELSALHPDLKHHDVYIDQPSLWCLRLASAVMMGMTGKVHGFNFKELSRAGDIFAENSWEIFATLVRVMRKNGLEDKLYRDDNGGELAKKARYIQAEWAHADYRKFKTEASDRELVRRAWPELSNLIVDPPLNAID